VKVHLQVDGSPAEVRESAREIAALGADGVFSFEGQHDVFFPLVVAAGETDLELMTNVAIAGPRSPLHLAHAAYDLQVFSQGRFRLGLGSQIRVHIEKRYGGQWGKPANRMAEAVAAVKAIFAAWEGEARLDFKGEAGKYGDMRTLITDEMVRTYGIVGTPEECATQIQNRYGTHASDVCCYFPGYTPCQADVAALAAAVQRIPAPPLVPTP